MMHMLDDRRWGKKAGVESEYVDLSKTARDIVLATIVAS